MRHTPLTLKSNGERSLDQLGCFCHCNGLVLEKHCLLNWFLYCCSETIYTSIYSRFITILFTSQLQKHWFSFDIFTYFLFLQSCLLAHCNIVPQDHLSCMTWHVEHRIACHIHILLINQVSASCTSGAMHPKILLCSDWN